MKRNHSILLLALAGVVLCPGLASAHIIPGTNHGFHDGFVHPFSGWDHLLAMFGVGLWASQCRGRALWLIPLAFISVMVLGGALGLTGAHLPGVEFGIALSVLVLGGLIATATRLKVGWGMGLVGLFALCHGYAHGLEMPAAVSALPFSVGFIIATLLLLGMGIAAGIYSARQSRALRLAGAAMALCSICFFLNLG
jgi:urease accessory protein